MTVDRVAGSELNKEALEAAVAETSRWDTGSTSRAGRPVEYHVLRMGDDGHYDIVSVHDNRAACDKSSERRVLGAAISAYLAALPASPPTAEVELRAEVERLRAQISALESLRPHWAQGYTSDSIAAQTATAALAHLWGLLGAKDQTEASAKLRAALATADREGKRDAPR